MIVDTVNAHAGDISIAALAPLTNIALALEIDPLLPEKVTELVIIGGSYGLTPYAWSQATGDNAVSEWNLFVDPEAAHRVFRAGFDLVAVGLDIATHPRINFRDSDLNRLRRAQTLKPPSPPGSWTTSRGAATSRTAPSSTASPSPPSSTPPSSNVSKSAATSNAAAN